jgi:hypothetical protein
MTFEFETWATLHAETQEKAKPKDLEIQDFTTPLEQRVQDALDERIEQQNAHIAETGFLIARQPPGTPDLCVTATMRLARLGAFLDGLNEAKLVVAKSLETSNIIQKKDTPTN